MAELAQKLKQTFSDWDEKQSGVVPVEMLKDILMNLNPSFSERDLDRLLKAVDSEGTGLVQYTNFVDFLTSNELASVAGAQLPTGTESDAKVARIHDTIAKLKDPRPGLKAWMQDMRELLDPHQNPSGYKLCQNSAVAGGAMDLLLALTRKRAGDAGKPLLEKDSDAIRSLAWEILARMAFGNDAGAEAVAGSADLLPCVRATLGAAAAAPERLSALQLVQAIATASGPACAGVVPAMLAEVAPLLSDASFRALQEAAFDVIASSSAGHAAAVAEAVGWSRLASLLSEGEERPGWLPAEPLQVFLCGRLAVDLLSQAPAPETASDSAAREALARGVAEGRFLGFYSECLEAAVMRREWPLGTQAYHSLGRLAELAAKLALLGHRRQLLPAVGPLAKAVEVGMDDQTSKAALRALLAVCMDVHCLEALLAMEAWRTETLEMLHKSGDEPEATELAAYMDAAELSFQAAQALLDASKSFTHHAPSVQRLAEIFVAIEPLDKELSPEQVMEAARAVPLLPSGVKATLGVSKLSFQAFAERVYGTPTVLGWWPSLMEDAAAQLQALGEVPRLPSLARAAELFEGALRGKSKLGAEAILEVLLPAAGLPAEDPFVEAELSALGTKELDFKGLVGWLGKICGGLRQAELAAEAEARAQAEAEAEAEKAAAEGSQA